MKRISDITQPDPQFGALVIADPETGALRPMTIEDHHHAVEGLVLCGGAPPSVSLAFETARHAFLYAWFSHDLTALAEQQGYAALEMALTDALNVASRHEPPRGLSQQMHRAFEIGLFEGLPLPTPDAGETRAAYFAQLVNRIRKSRNGLAHGAGFSNMPGAVLEALSICAALINHLYTRDSGAPNQRHSRP
jgi:hypothetical protein